MSLFSNPIEFLLLATGRIPAILFALSLHEAAHAWMSLRCGDDTAARMGRITLNPLAHLDPIGSIGIFLGFFGWGKPVPYVERNLRNPRWDAMLIAAAGPVSNLILAAISGIAFRILFPMAERLLLPMAEVGEGAADRIILFLLFLTSFSLIVNLFLCFFNLIPIFPLDGEKILLGFLPYRQAFQYSQLRQYGPMGLLLLVLIGGPLVSAWIGVLSKPFFYLFAGVSFNDTLAIIGLAFVALWGK
jgi:Zn-dependent protease